MPRVSEALQSFISLLKTGCAGWLEPHNDPAFLDRWSISMETQINVSASGGEPVEGKRHTYTRADLGYEWFNIRIPKGANSEPEFRDFELTWPLESHALGIGCTGWNWDLRCSRWVGFDFDDITGHAAGVGITDEKLSEVREAACALPWVEVRQSTGGKGFHLYVHLADVASENHTVHAALARAVLGKMAEETGFDFGLHVDTCGGNMWIWHQKMNAANGGLRLIKASSGPLTEQDLPAHWRDNVEVVRRRRSKVRMPGVEGDFDKLAGSQTTVALDDEHKRILEALRDTGFVVDWVPDHRCARVHTCGLQALADDPGMRITGVFQTNSNGTDPQTPNAFMFPVADGAWSVFRFSPGIAEARTWRQDGEGWTTCYFNRSPDLRTAAFAFDGRWDSDRDTYVFQTADQAIRAAHALGSRANVPDFLTGRAAELRISKNGALALEIDREKNDPEAGAQWLAKKAKWHSGEAIKLTADYEQDFDHVDSLVRYVLTASRREAGWLYHNEVNQGWDWIPKDSIRLGLLKHFGKGKVDEALCEAVNKRWTLVHLPFQPEYPGHRQLNISAPQYRYAPADEEADHATWDSILHHCFGDLNAPVKEDEWSKRHNVLRGYDYGLLWIACLLREPFQPLPYLFLFGDQNCGKSSLHEAIHLLLTGGVVLADRALKTQGDFNGELENAVLAVVEETNLSSAGATAYNRIKAWVTSPQISIRRMRMDSYEVPNTLHFIQTANERSACPVFPGDTRIVMLWVPPLETEIPRTELWQRLEEEAPAFMRTLLDVEIPSPEGRLQIPVIATASKRRAEKSNQDPLLAFIDEHIEVSEGDRITLKEFKERLFEHTGETLKRGELWDVLPEPFERGKPRGDTCIMNCRWRDA